MSWSQARLDWVADALRDTLDPSTLGDMVVDHFSIPALETHGGPDIVEASSIESGKQRVVGGEVLLSRLNPRKARVLRVPRVSERFMLCSGEFIVLMPRVIEGRFLEYLLLSESTRQYLDGAVQSVTRSHQRVRPEVLTKMWISHPRPSEQRAIADYLDTETARIDALIAKKRRMIEMLSERRVSILASAMRGVSHPTRGPSSIPWLPDVPRSWDQVMLKLVAKLGSGHTPSRNHPEWWIPEECVIPWVTTGEVSQMRSDRLEYLETTRECISEVGMANSSAVLHPDGTVVLCRTAASAGYSAIIAGDMAVSQDIAAWQCRPRLRPRFLLLCLRAMRADLLERLAMGSTHRTIYMPDIESIRVPLPPIEEQDRVVDEVWAAWHLIDRAVDQIEIQLERLAEHRQALITAAITGELDVSREA